MNDNTTEVRAASHEMAVGNQQILNEVDHLRDTTSVIKESMAKISESAENIKASSNALNDISGSVQKTVEEIGSQIDLFTV